MQKFICIIITTLLVIFIPKKVFAAVYYINYNNIEMTEQEYNNLLELGFNNNEIYYMNIDEFINNKNINGTLVGKSEQYYKTTTITKNGISILNNKVINEEQYEKQKDKTNTNIHSGYFGMVESEYKKMITSIIKIDEYQYRFKITLSWLKIPKIRSYDIIGIGLQPAYVQINSSIYAQQNYTYKNGNSSSSITCIPVKNKNGGSAIFKLPTGNIKELSSYLYYNVKKANDKNIITHMEAGGDYAHATSNINASIASRHSINHSSGLELNHSIKDYYDGINVATALWYGEW